MITRFFAAKASPLMTAAAWLSPCHDPPRLSAGRARLSSPLVLTFPVITMAGAVASTLSAAWPVLRRAQRQRPPRPERFPRKPVRAYELTVQNAFNRFDPSLSTRMGSPDRHLFEYRPSNRDALVASLCPPPVTVMGCVRLATRLRVRRAEALRTRRREDTSLRSLQPTSIVNRHLDEPSTPDR